VIVAFSTSSPLASVALIDADGSIIASSEDWAPMAASGACLGLLDKLMAGTGRSLSDAELFLSDLGPGSFNGVKVGVTLAKSLAFAFGKRAGGARSFDLIAKDKAVAFPSKRGEWFFRSVGREPVRLQELPCEEFIGFGPGIDPLIYPRAEKFSTLLDQIQPVAPELLVPEYLIEPSISQPKAAFRTAT